MKTHKIVSSVKGLRCSFSFISIAILLCFSCIALVANAQTTTPATTTTVTETVTPIVETPVEVVPTPPTEREMRGVLNSRVQERIENLAANISNRMDAAARRMNQIMKRIDSRIEKMNIENLDTREAEALLAQAQIALGNAEVQLATIDRMVIDATTSESPRIAWREVKKTYAAIKADLIETRDLIEQIVISLRAATTE